VVQFWFYLLLPGLTTGAAEDGGLISGLLVASEDVTVPNIAEETLACLLCKTRAAKRVCRSSRHFII
jgi:hypothetical protein